MTGAHLPPRQSGPPKPPTVLLADCADRTSVPLPPSVRAWTEHRPEDDAVLSRLIRGRGDNEHKPTVETSKDSAALDRRAAEDRRGGLTRRNKRLRDHADRIAVAAPTATCYRTAIHRTSVEVEAARVKCHSWGCPHCAKTKTARILSEYVGLFAHRERVCVTPLADDDARRRFKNRLDKNRQRTGLDVGAIVIPIAGSAFLAFGSYRDHEGDMFSLVVAFDVLDGALASRADIARMTGSDLDRRRISRPGLEPVRDSAKQEDPPLRSNADKTEERRSVGVMFREVSSADLAELVAQHNGKRGRKCRRNQWSYRFESQADADAFIVDLERLWDLQSDEKTSANRADRSSRRRWEDSNAPETPTCQGPPNAEWG